MKIICFSDIHGSEADLDLPECDILIFCGDFHIPDTDALQYTNRWFAKQKATYKIFVPGNHDTFLEKYDNEIIQTWFSNVIYLNNSGCEIEGLKFWGSAFSPEFNNWAFMYQRCSKEAKDIWKKIPKNLDFLITHCPPYQILDKNFYNEHCGCEVLQREIFKKKPKYHLFGHIHHEYGQQKIDDTQYINCSVLNEQYQLTRKPIILEI